MWKGGKALFRELGIIKQKGILGSNTIFLAGKKHIDS